MTPTSSRRNFLTAGLGLAVSAVVAACSRDSGTTSAAGSQATSTTGGTAPPTTAAAAGTTTGATATTLAATPACADADDLTIEQTEGPYFKANSPEKANLFADVSKGTKLVLTGSVVTTSCKPVNRALLDVWQADADGNYDNAGTKLRGHVFTDGQGGYRVETVVPGLYPGRTRHIHVKVQAPNGPVLTTQLYFPNEPRNASDGIYRKECLLSISDAADGSKNGGFQFVVKA
jgi:protocatechuate 3,4-dioxygenase beta subunit